MAWINRDQRNQAISTAIAALAIYFGAFGAYVLGAFSMVPKPLWQMLDETTLLYLAGNATFILLMASAIFRLAKPLAVTIYFMGNFLEVKFIVGRRYIRGIHHPTVARFYDIRNRRFMESGEGRARTFIFQLIVTISFVWEMFLSNANSTLVNLNAQPIIILYIAASLAAYRVGKRVSPQKFILSPYGRDKIVSVIIVLCFLFGAMRTSDLMNTAPLRLDMGDTSRSASPLFPVSGGELFFDAASVTFFVLRNDGSVLIWEESGTSKRR